MTEQLHSNFRRNLLFRPSYSVASGLLAVAFIATCTASIAVAQDTPVQPLPAQATPGHSAPSKAEPQKAAPSETPGVDVAPIPAKSAPAAEPDRATAYYHAALADSYEDMATNYGRQEFFSKAIEEYKLAINADPSSSQLPIGLAGLYLRAGRVPEAIQTAKMLIKADDSNIEAHKLLGRIYLRSLGQQQGSGGDAAPAGQMLDLAIAEFTKIVSLEPKSLEDRLLLGQLYSVKHDNAKAEAQFKAAQTIEPSSEDVVLNLARLYAESGDIKRSTELLEAIPADDRTGKEEFALGAAYEQLKDLKKAIAAYQRAVNQDPDNADATRALATAELADNQLAPALKLFQQMIAADPEDAAALDRISEIQRRQGKYTEALATIRKARAKEPPDNLEGAYNEGLILDVLGRYDEAVEVYQKTLDQSGHANGAYTQDEKSNRSVFLERLASVYHEQNKTTEAVATYQKMVDLGGEIAIRGYQGQIESYRDAKMYNEATAVSRKAVALNPDSRELKLTLAAELADTGKLDEGIALANGLLSGKPSDREVYLQISQIQMRLKHWKEAEDALAKADPFAIKDEEKANLFFEKGYLAEQEKHYDQAEQFFHKVLEIDPNNALTLNNLGYMLVDKTSRYNDALKFIRKAVDLDPMNGAYLDSLGWVYFKLGQYESAEDNLRKAVERTSTDPTVHDHLGDLYEKTGRIRLAAAQWEISLFEFSKSTSADIEPAEVTKVQKKLEGARVKLAKQDSHIGDAKQP
jgi:tetratricopeptide (TPR) repeat protein